MNIVSFKKNNYFDIVYCVLVSMWK